MIHLHRLCLTLIALLATACEPTSDTISADANAGKKLFQKKCATCHSLGHAHFQKRGPDLQNILERNSGSSNAYGAYSQSLQKLDIPWTQDALIDYLDDPSDFLRKQLGDPNAQSRMNVRIQDLQSRRDIVAYLKSP